MVLARDFAMLITKLVITTQDAVVLIIRSHTLIGVLSTRPVSMSLVLRLVLAVVVWLRLICNHLSGVGCPSIDEGQVEACTKVEK
jgi:hypothetical protein